MLRKMTKLVIAMVALVCMGGGIFISCSNSSDSVKPGSGGNTGDGEKVDPKIKYQYKAEGGDVLLTFYEDGTFVYKDDNNNVARGTYTKSGSKITGKFTSGLYKDWDIEVDTSGSRPSVSIDGNFMPGFEEVTTPINPNEPDNKDEPEPGDSDIVVPDYLVLKGTVISRFIESKLPDDGAVKIPEGVTGIDPLSQVFYFKKKIKSVTIPSTMTTICFDAFKLCENLTSVKIGDGVKEIGNSAFEDCKSLTSVNIPSSVTTIGYRAFSGCSNLTSVTFEDTVGWHYSIGGINVSDPTKNAENLKSSWVSGIYKDNSKPGVVIPEYLILKGTTVSGYIEEKLPKNGAIEIPEGVTSIGERAFEFCYSLKSVNIPSSVTTIGKYAFSYSYLESVNIADGVKEIGEYAFELCKSLESVNIPSSVTTIGKGAFYYCSNLTDITISKGVTEISDYAFYDCKLTEISIPDGVTKIGERAFGDCKNLKSVNIPSSVTTIGKYAFQYCSNLTDITILKGVTEISDYAFYRCEQLTEITIPDGVTKIGEGAFEECTSLKSVNIPSSVTTIGKGAFRVCSNLTDITIPKGVTEISDYAFCNCSFTGDLVIPASVTKIGEGAFAYNYELQSVTFEDTKDWYYNESKIDVTNPKNNAEELTSQNPGKWGSLGIYKQTN